jgi:hypothetical protein
MLGLGAYPYKYIDFLTSPDDDQAVRPRTLWPHQGEAFLRVLYSHEILRTTEIGADGLLLNVVTGGGKTAVIAAVVAGLRVAYDVQKLVMLCADPLVPDRLEDDFSGGRVFNDRDLLPDWTHSRLQDFLLTTLGAGKDRGWGGEPRSCLGAGL